MWKKLIPKTIRGKIIILTAAITLLITILTTTVCFSVFQSFLRKNQILSMEFSLSVISNNIGADMRDIIYFSKWCCSNSAILDYLEAFKDQPKLPTASRDFDNLRPMALSSHSRLKEDFSEYIAQAKINWALKAPFISAKYLKKLPGFLPGNLYSKIPSTLTETNKEYLS